MIHFERIMYETHKLIDLKRNIQKKQLINNIKNANIKSI